MYASLGVRAAANFLPQMHSQISPRLINFGFINLLLTLKWLTLKTRTSLCMNRCTTVKNQGQIALFCRLPPQTPIQKARNLQTRHSQFPRQSD